MRRELWLGSEKVSLISAHHSEQEGVVDGIHHEPEGDGSGVGRRGARGVVAHVAHGVEERRKLPQEQVVHRCGGGGGGGSQR